MQKRNFRHLPVIEEKTQRLVGVISAQDVVDSLSLAIGPETSSEDIVRSLEIPLHRIMSLHPIIVEKGDGLSEVAKKLVSHNIGALPVVDERGSVQGIITLRDLVGLLGTGSEPLDVLVSELATRELLTIEQEKTMAEAAHLMYRGRVRRLPVCTDRSKPFDGMLTNKDLLRLLARASVNHEGRGFNMPVSEIMTREIISVDVDDDVRVAASRMMIFGVGGLTVIDSEGRVVGLITERDLIKRLAERRSIELLVRAMKFELELVERTP